MMVKVAIGVTLRVQRLIPSSYAPGLEGQVGFH